LIVYVETNFVLELAYLRPTSDSCERLIDLARQKAISIVIPAFALMEARLAWQGIVKRRSRLHADVRTELAELARSRPLVGIGEQSQTFVAALIETAQVDRSRLESAIGSLAAHARIIPMEGETVSSALSIEQRLGLSPPDSLIYASVLHHMKDAGVDAKLFVTQNARDFAIPSIEDELASHGCKLLTAFDNAESFIRSRNVG
jgi:predicted nucleic acid-binding protein